MTTATASTPVTEELIRAAIAAGLEDPNVRGDEIGETFYRYMTGIRYIPEDERLAGSKQGLWTNLRPTEEARLEELMSTVYALEATFEKQLIDAIVKVALQFDAEYPEAPRATG